MKEGSFLKQTFCILLALLLSAAAIVIVFDPFYHYHAPLPGMKAVLNEKEYQCIGTLRHFSYDAVIAGSSMVENVNNADVNEAYDCKSIKAVRAYGAIADLKWMLEEGYKTHEVKHVFFNIDPSALHGSAKTTFAESGCPMYLYDNNVINDISYLFNKDVLLKRIPYEVAMSFSGTYDENLSFSWAEGKNFSKGGALSQYYRLPDAVKEKRKIKAQDANKEALSENILLLKELVKAHEETAFHFFFPVYSMLWWDMMERNGELESAFYEIKTCAEALLEEPGAEVFLFLNDFETATDLDHYMDTIHCSPKINERMLSMMRNGRFLLTKENKEAMFSSLETYVREEMLQKMIPALEEEDAFLYDYDAE